MVKADRQNTLNAYAEDPTTPSSTRSVDSEKTDSSSSSASFSKRECQATTPTRTTRPSLIQI
jgi:hypothetical protein